MALAVPFVRWDYDREPRDLTQHGSFYYVFAPGGHRETIGGSIHSETGHLVYRRNFNFVQNYAGHLPLGSINEWSVKNEFIIWIESVIYYSFLRHSIAGTPRCWFLKRLSSVHAPEELPLGLQPFFPAENLVRWIIIRHGSMVWPIVTAGHLMLNDNWSRFCSAHHLRIGCRVVFGCERRWVFNTFMFDEVGEEMTYDWTNPPEPFEQMHPVPYVLFAILNVGSRKSIKGSWVADLKIIDQSLKPMTVSLWDQFSEIEAAAMANLPGTFPVAIGMRLKRADYYGVGLATRNSTIFIFNPPIPEAKALQQWCIANADTIKEISLTSPSKMALVRYKQPTPDQIVKIINLPSKVEKPEYPCIEGVIKVTNFNQKFLYLACIQCSRTTDAYGEEEFYCNHCEQEVKALPKIMFQVKITDPTDSIEATIFAPPAENLFQITGAEMIEGTSNGHLSMPLLDKLSVTHNCTFHLKAYMYNYGGIEECKFNIQALFPKPTAQNEASPETLLLMAPETPNKKPKTTSYKPEQPSNPDTANSSNEMDEESETQTLKHSKKKTSCVAILQTTIYCLD